MAEDNGAERHTPLSNRTAKKTSHYLDMNDVRKHFGYLAEPSVEIVDDNLVPLPNSMWQVFTLKRPSNPTSAGTAGIIAGLGAKRACADK